MNALKSILVEHGRKNLVSKLDQPDLFGAMSVLSLPTPTRFVFELSSPHPVFSFKVGMNYYQIEDDCLRMKWHALAHELYRLEWIGSIKSSSRFFVLTDWGQRELARLFDIYDAMFLPRTSQLKPGKYEDVQGKHHSVLGTEEDPKTKMPIVRYETMNGSDLPMEHRMDLSEFTRARVFSEKSPKRLRFDHMLCSEV